MKKLYAILSASLLAGSALAASPSDVITTRPEGTVTDYQRSSHGYLVFWGMILDMDDQGAQVQIVEGTDGHSYINNLLCGVAIDAWFRCDVTDNTLTIPGGQAAYYNSEENELYTLEVLKSIGDEDNPDFELAEGKTSYTLTLVDGQYVSAEDPEYILGLYYHGETAMNSGWLGYGDSEYRLSKFEDKLVSLPEGLSAESWAMVTPDGGRFVNVALTDNAVYISNLCEGLEEGWVKADLTGDTGTFSLPQYVGVSEGYYQYAQSAILVREWDESIEVYFTDLYPTLDPVTLTFDREAKKITVSGVIAFTDGLPSAADWYATKYVDNPTISDQHRKPGTPPVAPQNLADDEAFSSTSISFSLPPLDIDGNLLDTERMYYNVYLNGQLYTFTPSVYQALSVDMIDVPYSYDDDWDFNVYGKEHQIMYYWYDADSIGVCVYYLEDDGSKTYSEMAILGENAVTETELPETIRTDYFDLNGLPADPNTASGILIRRTILSDGSVRTTKVAR